MQISYFAVMDNPEDEAALNAELARLRRIEQAARDVADTKSTEPMFRRMQRLNALLESK